MKANEELHKIAEIERELDDTRHKIADLKGIEGENKIARMLVWGAQLKLAEDYEEFLKEGIE